MSDLDSLLTAARNVTRWDWDSSNDDECLDDVEKLRHTISVIEAKQKMAGETTGFVRPNYWHDQESRQEYADKQMALLAADFALLAAFYMKQSASACQMAQDQQHKQAVRRILIALTSEWL